MRKVLYLTILLLYIIVSYLSGGGLPRFDRGQVLAAATGGAKTDVKAEIAGKFSLRLFGYTSADAVVQVLGVRTYAQGTSDRTGYFVFYDISVAVEAREICISAIDSERRVSFPVCITLPDTLKPTEIGPVLLAPTLSLSNSALYQNQHESLLGTTIPETEVVVSFFEIPEENSNAKSLSMNTQCRGSCRSSFPDKCSKPIFCALAGMSSLASPATHVLEYIAKLVDPKVEAADLPTLSIKSDSKGRFSVSLPTSYSVSYRVFAKAYYRDPSTPTDVTSGSLGMTGSGQPTPKSQTLLFTIGAYTDYFTRFILPYLMFYLLIILLLIFLIYFERKNNYVRPYIKRWMRRFIEKKLKPLAVRRILAFRRLLYNFREHLR